MISIGWSHFCLKHTTRRDGPCYYGWISGLEFVPRIVRVAIDTCMRFELQSAFSYATGPSPWVQSVRIDWPRCHVLVSLVGAIRFQPALTSWAARFGLVRLLDDGYGCEWCGANSIT